MIEAAPAKRRRLESWHKTATGGDSVPHQTAGALAWQKDTPCPYECAFEHEPWRLPAPQPSRLPVASSPEHSSPPSEKFTPKPGQANLDSRDQNQTTSSPAPAPTATATPPYSIHEVECAKTLTLFSHHAVIFPTSKPNTNPKAMPISTFKHCFPKAHPVLALTPPRQKPLLYNKPNISDLNRRARKSAVRFVRGSQDLLPELQLDQGIFGLM